MPNSSDSGFFQRQLSVLEKLWPISLLAMIFTFLSQIETVMQYSALLAEGLLKWRAILDALWEVPINILLAFVGAEINLVSPVPEVLFFMSVFVFSTLRHNQFDEIHSDLDGRDSINKISGLEWVAYWPVIALMVASRKANNHVVFVIPYSLSIAIIAFVFFKSVFLTLAIPIIVLALTVILIKTDKSNSKFARGIGVFIVFTSHIIVYYSVVIIMLSYALESVADPAGQFKCDAFEAKDLELPAYCK